MHLRNILSSQPYCSSELLIYLLIFPTRHLTYLPCQMWLTPSYSEPGLLSCALLWVSYREQWFLVFTGYVTSASYPPVRDLADACEVSAASNVTLGLTLGYMSTVITVIIIAVTAFASSHLIGYYGVSLAALGMLSNLTHRFPINTSGILQIGRIYAGKLAR